MGWAGRFLTQAGLQMQFGIGAGYFVKQREVERPKVERQIWKCQEESRQLHFILN